MKPIGIRYKNKIGKVKKNDKKDNHRRYIYDSSTRIFKEGQKVSAIKMSDDEWEVKKGKKTFILYDDDFKEEI